LRLSTGGRTGRWWRLSPFTAGHLPGSAILQFAIANVQICAILPPNLQHRTDLVELCTTRKTFLKNENNYRIKRRVCLRSVEPTLTKVKLMQLSYLLFFVAPLATMPNSTGGDRVFLISKVAAELKSHGGTSLTQSSTFPSTHC
jgi:hypothetical protein